MSALVTKLTVDDYYSITVEGDRKQLVDGAIVVNEPKSVHAALQFRLVVALGKWIDAGEGRRLGTFPTDVVIDDHNVFGPDVLWVAERNRPTDLRDGLARIPDICVEVRSQSTWRYDIGAKKSAYERGGLPELWLVDSEAESVLVYRRDSRESPSFDVSLELTRDDVLTSPQLPGFELRLRELFEL